MPNAMEIVTPSLSAGVTLLFHRMHAREELGRMSEYRLELLSESMTVPLDDILGQNVTIKLLMGDEESYRYFNGFVSRFSAGGRYGRYFRYTATVRPWLWFLTRTADCRIFQEKSVPEIVEEVLADHPGFGSYEFDLTESYPRRTYCVQYRESDFNFISRLLEHEGISYYYRHAADHHTVVFTDTKHYPNPGYDTLEFIDAAHFSRPNIDHVSSWDVSREVQPGVYAHTDYNFERPNVDLRTKQPLQRTYKPSDYEVFDYPGFYLQKADGESLARVRIDEYGSQFETSDGITNCRGLRVGHLFTLASYPREDQNGEHLVVSATFDLEFSDYEGTPGDGATSFQCRFVAMATNTQRPFRPQRLTAQPFVQGPQTAVVVGPSGEEIFTDEFGRVKVQFHWDRRGTKNDQSSCWVRVSQYWAGKGWGALHLPRIGHEVIVDFLEGDPDQPIIVGRVYNAVNKVPYTLPENKTQSGVKSRSSLDGAPDNFNEIRFEDQRGKEHVAVHAERNLNVLVKANERRTIGNNSTVSIGKEKGDPKKEGKATTTINGDTSTTIVKGDLSLDVQTGKMTVHVKGKVEETFDDTSKLTVTNEIKLICGASSITLKNDGTIEIVGVNIKVNGSAKVATSGAMIDSAASGIQSISGGLVKINS